MLSLVIDITCFCGRKLHRTFHTGGRKTIRCPRCQATHTVKL